MPAATPASPEKISFVLDGPWVNGFFTIDEASLVETAVSVTYGVDLTQPVSFEWRSEKFRSGNPSGQIRSLIFDQDGGTDIGNDYNQIIFDTGDSFFRAAISCQCGHGGSAPREASRTAFDLRRRLSRPHRGASPAAP